MSAWRSRNGPNMVPIKCCMGIRRSPEIDAAGKRPTPKSAEEQPADSFADRIRKGQYSHVQALVPCTDDSIDDPDTLNEFENDDRDTLLPLQGDTLAERFPEEVQQHIRDLVHTAKRCLQKRTAWSFFVCFVSCGKMKKGANRKKECSCSRGWLCGSAGRHFCTISGPGSLAAAKRPTLTAKLRSLG